MTSPRSRPALHEVYERELAFLHKAAHDFAAKHGERAQGLLIEPHRCNDPHIERLIESCALLTARVQLKLDDGFSDIADAMLDVLYPHYLAPVPPQTIVQFHLEPGQGQKEGGVLIPRHAPLQTRGRIKGVPLRFRTCYETRLFPIRVAAVELISASAGSLGLQGPDAPVGVESALRIVLRSTTGLPIQELGIRQLRFFLDGEPGVTYPLYELLFARSVGLAARTPGARAVLLSPDRSRPLGVLPVGFEAEESMLDYPESALDGYRVVQEYFAYPEKFLFVTLDGLDRAPWEEKGDGMELLVLLDRLPSGLSDRLRFEHDPARPGKRSVLQLGCTPAVNLFRHLAEPIRLTHRVEEYPVIPEARARELFEVHRIEEVTSTVVGSGEPRRFHPIYSLQHGGPPTEQVGFWHSRRLAFDDGGTDVFLTLIDRAFDPARPVGVEVLHVVTTCTNRNALIDAQFAGDSSDLQLEKHPDVSGAAVLRHPTSPGRANIHTPVDSRDPRFAGAGGGHGQIRSESRWRLVSHLTFNHLSLAPQVEPGADPKQAAKAEAEALRAFQEILRLYDPLDSQSCSKQIAGVSRLRSRRVTRIIPEVGAVRGLELQIELDPPAFPGNSAYLFGAILDRFFALHCSLNSFTQTSLRVVGSDEHLKEWPPRIGERTLL